MRPTWLRKNIPTPPPNSQISDQPWRAVDSLYRWNSISTNLQDTARWNVSAATTPAPEPASWAMMLGGFGMIGGALRARRKSAIPFA